MKIILEKIFDEFAEFINFIFVSFNTKNFHVEFSQEDTRGNLRK